MIKEIKDFPGHGVSLGSRLVEMFGLLPSSGGMWDIAADYAEDVGGGHLAFIFRDRMWVPENPAINGYGYGSGAGYGAGDGAGDGAVAVAVAGSVAGDGDGHGDGYGSGCGDGDGDGYGDGYGDGAGSGDGSGYGAVAGDGYG